MLTLAQLADYFLDMSRTDEDTSLRQLWANLAADVDSYIAGHGPADMSPTLEIEVTRLKDPEPVTITMSDPRRPLNMDLSTQSVIDQLHRRNVRRMNETRGPRS